MNNITLNQAQCIKEQVYFGFTRYYDICRGTEIDVNWGPGSYVAAVFFAIFVFGLVLFFIGLFRS